MNIYPNQSFKNNNNSNTLKLMQKSKSLNNFNTNTLKVMRNSNSSLLNNSNSKPIKIKNNHNNLQIIDNQKDLIKSKSSKANIELNDMIQEYNYFKNLYKYPNNNISKNKYKYKLNIKRPSTAPQKDKNKNGNENAKEVINIQNINKSMNNPNIFGDEKEQIYNLYYKNNNKKLRTQLIKKQKKNMNNIYRYNKLLKHSEYRPPSPMIGPNIRLNDF